MIDKTTKIIIGIAVILAIALVAMLVIGSNPEVSGNIPAVNNIEGTSKESIKIGFVGPLTGDVSVIGQQNKAAIEMAVDEINSKGGIDGRKIEMIYEDGKCNAKDAASAGNKLINVDKVKYIIGGECSGETLAIAPTAEANKVLMISPISSSPDVTKAGDYVFRNYYSDNDAGKALAQRMYKDLGYKKVAVLWSINDYAEGYSRVFRDEFTRLGGQIVFQEKFTQGTSDLRAPLTKLKATDAEAIVLLEYTAGQITFYKQREELGIKIPVFGSDTSTDPEVQKAVGKAMDGTRYILAAESYTPEFAQRIKEKTGEDIQLGSPQAYDVVYILKQAIETTGDDSTKVKNYLYKMPAFHGEAGKTEFDENGDLKGPTYVMWEIQNGKPVLLD
jgi:branched-chain amino acid transport system substrate-binding protein